MKGWIRALRNKLFATKAAVFNALDGVPIYRFKDYESYLVAGSKKLWATWKATDITANVVMDTPYRLLDRRGEPLERPPAPLVRLLTYPNQHETFSEFLYRSVFHLKWVGNCFWFKSETTMDGERPREMFLLNPARIQIVPDRELGIVGYIYRVKGQDIPLDIEDVIHFRRPHPNNEFFGLGEMEAGEKSLLSQINRDTYEEKFWQNGGVPSGIMKAKFQADEEDLKLAQKRFQEKYGGVSNSAKVAFITGDYEFQQLGLSSQQMQFLEQRKSNVEEIFLLHGVPLSVAGIRDAANFATAEIDDNRFRRYTIKPLIKTFRDTINTDLIAGFGDMFLEWEVSGLHPIGKIIQDYVPLFDRGGMTINELRAKAGLPTDPDNPLWQNQTFINAGMLPLDLAGLSDMGRTDQAARSIVDDFTRRALTPGQGNGNGRNHELEGRT